MYYKSATDIRIAQLEIKLAKLERLAKEAGLFQDAADWLHGLKLNSHPVMHTILNYLKTAFPDYTWHMDRTIGEQYGSFRGKNKDFAVSFEFTFLEKGSLFVDHFYITPLNKSIDPYRSKLVLSDKEVGFNIPNFKSDFKAAGLWVAEYVEAVMKKYTIERRREKSPY